MNTVLVTGPTLNDEYRARLEEAGCKLKLEPKEDLNEEELIAALDGVFGYILGGVEKVTKRVIESAKDLRIIAFYGVGYETYIDAKAAAKSGIAVTNAPEANAQSVAEFAVAIMLDAVRRLTYLAHTAKQGQWNKIESWELEGKTLGIIGMGAIGLRTAKIAHDGFGMKIKYYSRTRKLEAERRLQAEFSSLEDLLSSSDVVSLHTSLTPETHHLIGEKQLALMKKTSVLINTGRPDLIDPKALLPALRQRKIGAVAMDSYYQEPTPTPVNDPYGLLALSDEMLLVYPHTAYYTEDAARAMADMNVSSILALATGRQPPYVVNPEYTQFIQQKTLDDAKV